MHMYYCDLCGTLMHGSERRQPHNIHGYDIIYNRKKAGKQLEGDGRSTAVGMDAAANLKKTFLINKFLHVQNQHEVASKQALHTQTHARTHTHSLPPSLTP